MDDIAFGDWPGQPVDLSGSNPWLPAYGFQPPHSLLDKDDFIGNPDADLFFNGNAMQHYVYLETIQEETSDDLQSDSERSESRGSPVGWLATDSESGSVIRINAVGDPGGLQKETESLSRRLPPQDSNFLCLSDDESNYSISRSSSLLQFESLEKQCQDLSTSSPSILSSLSYDSLENRRNVENVENDYYRTLKIEKAANMRDTFNVCSLQDEYLNVQVTSSSSEETLNTSGSSLKQSRSFDDVQKGEEDSLMYNHTANINMKKSFCSLDDLLGDEELGKKLESGGKERSLTLKRASDLHVWNSFDNLPVASVNQTTQKAKDRVSAENLSEDSGYSDHFCTSMKVLKKDRLLYAFRASRSSSDFDAYDCDVNHSFSNTNLGVSYHDLRLLGNNRANKGAPSATPPRRGTDGASSKNTIEEFAAIISDAASLSSSVPDLLLAAARSGRRFVKNRKGASKAASDAQTHSVPKDLNLLGAGELWTFGSEETSVAAQNLDLCDAIMNRNAMADKRPRRSQGNTATRIFIPLKGRESSSPEPDATASFKREGSYQEAMENSIDFSDEERKNRKPNKLKTTIASFDREILKAISETSIASLNQSGDLQLFFTSTPNSTGCPKRNSLVIKSTPNIAFLEDKPIPRTATPPTKPRRYTKHRNSGHNHYDNKAVISTPNLSTVEDEPRPRKSSLTNRRSSSTNEIEERSKPDLNYSKSFNESEKSAKELNETRSISGSIGSKGVHFCPIVAEVNWKDEHASTEHETSSSSAEPSPDRGPTLPFAQKIASSSSEREVNDIHDDDLPFFLKRGQHDEHLRRDIIRPEPRKPDRISASQPDLNLEKKREQRGSIGHDDFVFVPLRPKPPANSQPNYDGLKRRGSHIVKREPDGTVLQTYVDADGVTYRHTRLANTPTTASAPTSGPESHMSKSGQASAITNKQPVSGMDSLSAVRERPKRSNKLGGFFSRLASFRFSTRKKQEAAITKPNADHQQVPKYAPVPPERKDSAKVDYIYIPLKDPSVNNNEDAKRPAESVCSAKPPPVPKMPPKIVGASVKRRLAPTGAAPDFTRNGIDSGTACPMEQMGLIETDLDTEVTVITSGAHVKTRSLMNLGADAPQRCLAAPTTTTRPHKSMEFLLDKQNLKVVEPPENELQKCERVMSEHELRVQRSLQKLTVPDWYKQAQVPKEGFILKKSGREARWAGTGSKTTSLSSLGSSNQSPLVLSPTPHGQPFVRWSTSKLNSTASSPCASTRSSFNARQPNGSISPSSLRSSFSYRQPYLGWRSQERLARPRTPAERLAVSLMNNQESPEIQTSIKEVTSAIVHYVSGLKPEDNARDLSDDNVSQRSRSLSPRGSQKLYWLESSFVGTRPLDSPQTPVTLSESQNTTPVPPSSLKLDLQTHNDLNIMRMHSAKPSPESATLEDVLDSLLGLPSSTRAPSPSLQGTASASTSPARSNDNPHLNEPFRRRSEGSEPAGRRTPTGFHSSPVLRCRYSRCARVAIASTTDGLAFKNCHNCSYTYCSRACRRAHWEKHRKTCLFSRIGSLCRQVIAAAKEQHDTLLHLSVIARRGYLSHGLGAVKCFFPCPEAAEKFLQEGLDALGEITYVRWPDLLPSEMGSQLYAELVKMCKNYNPDSKLVLYVSVCVVSEAPAAGAVKWERQLVSRCAKLRLSKDIPIPEKDQENPETLILTCKFDRTRPALEARQISFDNIQKHLRQRGVSLKRQYPDIYKLLSEYVNGNCDKFKPVTVYPRDAETGKTFMCIIMPDADPESLKQVIDVGVKVRSIDVLNEE